MRNAWTFGLQFLSGRLLLLVAILLGIGLLPGYLIQLAVDGQLGASRPTLASPDGMDATAGAGLAAILVLLASYVLQTGSFFAALRIGLNRAASPVGAIGYGLLAGLLAATVFAVFVVGTTILPARPMSMGAFILVVLVYLLPLAAAFALFYTLLAAALAVAVTTLLAIAMVFGAATGNLGFAATLVGGSGFVAVILIVLSMVMLWIAARLSCVVPIMAERRSFNLFAAIAQSWRLTWEEEWAIFRYLGLIGFALLLIGFGLVLAAGASILTFGDPAAAPSHQAAGIVIGVAISLPLALLCVLVPAGIYRELDQGSMTAEVFA